MSIFQKQDTYFDQALFENSAIYGAVRGHNALAADSDSNQFILMQLTGDEKRIVNTSAITPTLKGDSDKPDVNMQLDFESFKIGRNEDIDRKTKATLQLQIGQEKKIDALDKLFYCINGGMDLYNELKGKKTDAKDFKKSTEAAMGNKPISMPGGMGQITLKVVKHEEPKWWQRVFSFAKSDTAKELFSLIGFPGITETALNCVSGMLDSLFDREPEILFQSQPIKVGFTQSAREELSGGLSTNYVSCLNQGFWVMVRKADYQAVLDAKPIYYGGYGILAPDGMSEIDALRDEAGNPFSRITYAVIRSRIKEVDLKQGMF